MVTFSVCTALQGCAHAQMARWMSKESKHMANFAHPDPTAFVFTLGEVSYGFILNTRTFWGAQAFGTSGSASLALQIDDQGNLRHGKVLVTGAIADKNIPNKSLLLEGDAVGIYPSSGNLVQFNILFRMTHVHANLGYVSPIGIWNASVLPKAPLLSAADAFKVNWQSAAPLNSYFGQVRTLIT
jgi:hypothetical protein